MAVAVQLLYFPSGAGRIGGGLAGALMAGPLDGDSMTQHLLSLALLA